MVSFDIAAPPSLLWRLKTLTLAQQYIQHMSGKDILAKWKLIDEVYGGSRPARTPKSSSATSLRSSTTKQTSTRDKGMPSTRIESKEPRGNRARRGPLRLQHLEHNSSMVTKYWRAIEATVGVCQNCNATNALYEAKDVIRCYFSDRTSSMQVPRLPRQRQRATDGLGQLRRVRHQEPPARDEEYYARLPDRIVFQFVRFGHMDGRFSRNSSLVEFPRRPRHGAALPAQGDAPSTDPTRTWLPPTTPTTSSVRPSSTTASPSSATSVPTCGAAHYVNYVRDRREGRPDGLARVQRRPSQEYHRGSGPEKPGDEEAAVQG